MAALENSADHGPIDPRFTELMNVIARELDVGFNPQILRGEERTVGFFLTTFEFNKQDGRFNYISNAAKRGVRVMLKDVLARLEARMQLAGRA